MKKLMLILICVSPLAAYIIAQNSQPGIKQSIEKGKKIYDQYCLTCHQADGGGVPQLNPPLIKTSYVLGDKDKLIKWVLKGTQEKIPIDDEYYSNNMPPQNYLSDQQIADVLTFIRNNFGNKASAIQSDDVKAIRASLK